MLSTAKVLRFQQRRTFGSLGKLGKLPSESNKPQVSLDKDCIDFLPWLEQIAGSKVSNTLSIGLSTYGRSLFASKVIHVGDSLLQVPFKAQITLDELPPDIKLSLTNEVGSIGKLAAVLLIQMKMGQNSQWFPYISRLPQPAQMHSTILWDEDELNMIRCSEVLKETIKQKAQIEKEYSLVANAFSQHISKVIKRPDLEDFMYAYALVGSRAWETSKGICLIPFADFMNHDGLSASIILSDEDNQLSEATADRNYSPGEEVLICYGEFSNASLMSDFGFTLPYNIHDEVQIQIDIPNNDPLRMMKLGLLQTHRTRSVKNISIFHSSCNTYTIKEVKSAKGRGIPQSLRAFARILCCTSPQELNDLRKEAEQNNDGRLARLPFKDRKREMEAHKIILSHINILIEEHSVCIKEMEGYNCNFVSERRKMAKDLIFENETLKVMIEKLEEKEGEITILQDSWK